MEKISDQAYEFKGTRFHLRAFEDPLKQDKPVFVIEEGTDNATSLNVNRVELANELADVRGYTPDQVTWLELASDGSLKEVSFQYTHTDNISPSFNDMRMDERQGVERDESMGFLRIDRYNTTFLDADRAEMQSVVGDALEPYEVRQNAEFAKMELPSIVIDLDGMRRFPSQQDFENEPDLTY